MRFGKRNQHTWINVKYSDNWIVLLWNIAAAQREGSELEDTRQDVVVDWTSRRCERVDVVAAARCKLRAEEMDFLFQGVPWGGSLLSPPSPAQPVAQARQSQEWWEGGLTSYNCLQPNECAHWPCTSSSEGLEQCVGMCQWSKVELGFAWAAAWHSCLCICNVHPASLTLASCQTQTSTRRPDTISRLPVIMILIAFFICTGLYTLKETLLLLLLLLLPTLWEDPFYSLTDEKTKCSCLR